MKYFGINANVKALYTFVYSNWLKQPYVKLDLKELMASMVFVSSAAFLITCFYQRV